MSSVCFYFQVHQPYRLRPYSYFDAARVDEYFDADKNGAIARKVAEKCYLPTNKLMLELIEKHQGAFKISYSISGVAIEQFAEYCPDVLESFQELVRTGCVEILAETYHHSLASVMDEEEFHSQIELHADLVRDVFDVTPSVFRNTELVYNDRIGQFISQLGYKGIIAEGCDDILDWRSPNFVYRVPETSTALLLKNYRLSDDIAFRFSDKGWESFPLNADTYASWLHSISGNGETVNLFMDYETFGEHQWESTGIFNFMRYLPEKVLQHGDWDFKTPSEVIDSYPMREEIHFHRLTSWADVDRDLTAWRGNRMQEASLSQAFLLRDRVIESGDEKLIEDWRKLLTSDHFYYMCTKWAADGDVHAYFSPYESPYEAFINYSNCLRGFISRLEKLEKMKSTISAIGDVLPVELLREHSQSV